MLAQQKQRWNKAGLTVSQWHSMTSEAEHAVGMQYFMDRAKYCLGFSDKDQICLKIMVFSKKKSLLEISVRFLTFNLKIIVFSKKKGLHLGLASDFSNSIPKPWCSLLCKKIKVITQKFIAHAKHDLQALTT